MLQWFCRAGATCAKSAHTSNINADHEFAGCSNSKPRGLANNDGTDTPPKERVLHGGLSELLLARSPMHNGAVASVSTVRRPGPQTVGHGVDFSASATGTISSAVGSFDTVTGVTSVTARGRCDELILTPTQHDALFTSVCANAAMRRHAGAFNSFCTPTTASYLCNFG